MNTRGTFNIQTIFRIRQFIFYKKRNKNIQIVAQFMDKTNFFVYIVDF